MSELIEKYIKVKKINQDVDIYMPIGMSRSTFTRMRKGRNKPQKLNVVLLTIGLRLTYEEAEDFIETAGYSLDRAENNENPELKKNLKYILDFFSNRKLNVSYKEIIGDAILGNISYENLKKQLI